MADIAFFSEQLLQRTNISSINVQNLFFCGVPKP